MILQLCRRLAQNSFVVYPRGAYRIALVVALAGASALYSETAAAQATFTPLGQFGGVRSDAYDISADGSVIVGTMIALPGATVSVFRVTPQGITVRSTGFTQSDFSREPSVSADGSTVVGTFQSPSGEEAFRWIGDAPFERLGDLPGGDFQSNAIGVSADGSVVVGASQTNSRLTAFRWTAGAGMVPLGGDERTAHAVSADGAVVVGGLWVSDDNAGPAYRWTAQTGSIELPIIPRPRPAGAEARAVTPDGSVVVGHNAFRLGLSAGTSAAFGWTEEDGTIDLEAQGWGLTVALDVSADGSVIVGSGSDPATTSSAAFIWTAETGMLNLQDVLVFGGATNLDAWTLSTANGISADGRTVVGTGFGPNGREAFVATIGAIPEPSTLVLAALGTVGFVGLSLRKQRSRAMSLRLGGFHARNVR